MSPDKPKRLRQIEKQLEQLAREGLIEPTGEIADNGEIRYRLTNKGNILARKRLKSIMGSRGLAGFGG